MGCDTPDEPVTKVLDTAVTIRAAALTPPSQRFRDALAAGEVTRGGLAEAGWFDIGTIADEGIVFTSNVFRGEAQ